MVFFYWENVGFPCYIMSIMHSQPFKKTLYWSCIYVYLFMQQLYMPVNVTVVCQFLPMDSEND